MTEIKKEAKGINSNGFNISICLLTLLILSTCLLAIKSSLGLHIQLAKLN